MARSRAKLTVRQVALTALSDALAAGCDERVIEEAMQGLLRLQCLAIADYVSKVGGQGSLAPLAQLIREGKWDK